jgi:hypothetical protein
MINNEYGVKRITMYPKAICYCPLGKDWYTNKFEVEMQVKDVIPDYCEVEKWLGENIRGKPLIIEEAVRMFREYLIETYSPASIELTSSVSDAKHFPVRIEA